MRITEKSGLVLGRDVGPGYPSIADNLADAFHVYCMENRAEEYCHPYLNKHGIDIEQGMYQSFLPSSSYL